MEGATIFHAENLGHPLLSARICVVNNLHLDRESSFYLVSGSNMSGKSTWLRSIGIAAVLAAAGDADVVIMAAAASYALHASTAAGIILIVGCLGALAASTLSRR